jgi:glycosyltransferase involved in cell wall biosynthesis
VISVVIPTRNRPDLLRRAVDSALAQTHRDLEVVVVVDGADDATEAALRSVDDARLHWIVNAEPVGGSEARNVGVRAAAGEWIAFLDDDDEWLPSKLERQLAAAMSANGPVLVGCRIITRTPRADYVGPERPLREDEHLSDYLFRPRRPFARGARLQTSAFFTSRDLALAVPWDPGVRRFQDFDWLLRVYAAGAAIVIVPEVLSIWRYREARPSIGGRHAADWRQALEWIDERRHLVTRRSYARWVLARTAALAAGAPDRPSFRALWRKAREHGNPAPIDVVQFAVYALVARWRRRKPLPPT